MKVSAAVVAILQKEGVEVLTCFPGNPIIEEAAKAGIRVILTRNERVGANIADGYTRVTFGLRNAAMATQAGPGTENAFPGVIHAHSDSTPVLFLPGGLATGRTDTPPGFSAVKNYQAATKWVSQLNSPSRLVEMMHRAFTRMRLGEPGPAMLELPGDVTAAEIDDAVVNSYKPVKRRKSLGDPADVKEAVSALLAAKAPVIYVGQGIFYAQAWDELKEFAELVQLPVVTTLNGKSAFPENHPLSAGTGGRTCPEAVNHFLKKADLVFGIGTSFYYTQYNAPIPPGKTFVQITADPHDTSNDYRADVAVIGDARLVLRQLIDEVKRQAGPHGRRNDTSVATELKAIREAWLKEWLPSLTSDEVPINPYRLHWDIMHTVDRTRTIITHDAGSPRDQMIPFYESLIPRGYIGWGKTTTMGFGMGAAMGAKVAAPDKICMNVMGDGAFGMVGMDFETAVRCRIPIITMILNNGTLGGHNRTLPVATQKYNATNMSGDYAKIGEGLGAHVEKVTKPADIIPALRRAIEANQAGRPVLMDVVTKDLTGSPKAFSLSKLGPLGAG
jgi:acetolactate synthase-1/2/3 large subunit